MLFAGEKGLLCSDGWGVGGIVKLKGEETGRGVLNHEACKPVPVTLPRVPGQFHVGEGLTACKGGPKTFQGFESAAMVAEIAMVGMLAIHFKPGVNTFATIAWDSQSLKVKGKPAADAVINGARAIPRPFRDTPSPSPTSGACDPVKGHRRPLGAGNGDESLGAPARPTLPRALTDTAGRPGTAASRNVSGEAP
jgi:hypothetical protein